MIAAERLLLASALEDQSNQRFVLLSDRCVFLSALLNTHRLLLRAEFHFSYIHVLLYLVYVCLHPASI